MSASSPNITHGYFTKFLPRDMVYYKSKKQVEIEPKKQSDRWFARQAAAVNRLDELCDQRSLLENQLHVFYMYEVGELLPCAIDSIKADYEKAVSGLVSVKGRDFEKQIAIVRSLRTKMEHYELIQTGDPHGINAKSDEIRSELDETKALIHSIYASAKEAFAHVFENVEDNVNRLSHETQSPLDEKGEPKTRKNIHIPLGHAKNPWSGFAMTTDHEYALVVFHHWRQLRGMQSKLEYRWIVLLLGMEQPTTNMIALTMMFDVVSSDEYCEFDPVCRATVEDYDTDAAAADAANVDA